MDASDATIESFRRLVDLEQVDEEELLAEVASFAALIEKAARRFRFVFVPTWSLPPWQRGIGVFDARPGGVGYGLAAMNRRPRRSPVGGPQRPRPRRTALDRGRRAGDSTKAWYLGKVPFDHATSSPSRPRDIKAPLRGLTGGARKLLVLDLDDTLWGGIVGDVGWEKLRLGGHDGEGEAFVDFQRAVKAVTRRGVRARPWSARTRSPSPWRRSASHPEMVLREEDFVGHRINWQDKARNIADLAAELNLGLQSVVFIDDNPVERARVREALPEVLVPEWPSDKLLYRQAFLALDCFDSPSVTEEDAAAHRAVRGGAQARGAARRRADRSTTGS